MDGVSVVRDFLKMLNNRGVFPFHGRCDVGNIFTPILAKTVRAVIDHRSEYSKDMEICEQRLEKVKMIFVRVRRELEIVKIELCLCRILRAFLFDAINKGADIGMRTDFGAHIVKPQ